MRKKDLLEYAFNFDDAQLIDAILSGAPTAWHVMIQAGDEQSWPAFSKRIKDHEDEANAWSARSKEVTEDFHSHKEKKDHSKKHKGKKASVHVTETRQATKGSTNTDEEAEYDALVAACSTVSDSENEESESNEESDSQTSDSEEDF
ncbi:hypothetical protein FRC11_007659 [Ceratobasidium sp. 423]|nr:hypothetical protein FRC11_007659 [Ceratobasidium sp. 423]